MSIVYLGLDHVISEILQFLSKSVPITVASKNRIVEA